MEKDRKVKALAIVALVIAVVGLTVAFAAMSQVLVINGTATIEHVDWDIHFENLVNPVPAADITGTAEIATGGMPTIQAGPAEYGSKPNTAIGDYSVILKKPGDSVTFTFDVVNNGDIDADLGTFTLPTPTCNATETATAEADNAICQANIVYTLKYSDGTTVKTGDALDKKSGNTATRRTMKLTIGYKEDAEELPTNDVPINGMGFTLPYNQRAN